jgi:hypothetical protein
MRTTHAQCVCAQAICYLSFEVGEIHISELWGCWSAQQCAVVFEICYDKWFIYFGIHLDKYFRLILHKIRCTILNFPTKGAGETKKVHLPVLFIPACTPPRVWNVLPLSLCSAAVPGFNLARQETGGHQERIDQTINGHCLALPQLLQWKTGGHPTPPPLPPEGAPTNLRSGRSVANSWRYPSRALSFRFSLPTWNNASVTLVASQRSQLCEWNEALHFRLHIACWFIEPHRSLHDAKGQSLSWVFCRVWVVC